MQIRFKLAIQFSLIVATILLLFAITIYVLHSNYRKQEFESRLNNEALTIANLLIQVDEVSSDILKIINKNSLNVLYEEQVVVFDSLNAAIYYSNDDKEHNIPTSILDKIRQQKKLEFKIGINEAVGILYDGKSGDYVVIASAFDKFGLDKLKNLRLILLLGLLASVILTIIAGLFFSSQALRPIANIIHQINNVNISNLSSRIHEGNKKDEMAQLAIQFNKMLDRLQAAFEMQKNFVSNASHELRTPLTLMTNQIEVSLLKERSQEEYKTTLKNLLDEVKDLTSLTNGLLELAQSSMDLSSILIKEIRIDELLLQIQTDWIYKNPDHKIFIEFKEMNEEDSLSILGNESLIKTVFINLIDNALKFSESKIVYINISFGNKKIIVDFKDNGVGIHSDDMEFVFEPFYRANNAQHTKGHGIGLSLCKKIIQLHSGLIAIDSSINKGTTVSITLPYSF